MNMNPVLIKTFLKGMGAKPEHLKLVDAFFSIKWDKPERAAWADYSLGRDNVSRDECGDLVLNGLTADGKWVTILVQTQTKDMLPVDLLNMMGVGNG